MWKSKNLNGKLKAFNDKVTAFIFPVSHDHKQFPGTSKVIIVAYNLHYIYATLLIRLILQLMSKTWDQTQPDFSIIKPEISSHKMKLKTINDEQLNQSPKRKDSNNLQEL